MIRQHPSKCRLREGCAAGFVWSHIVQARAHQGFHYDYADAVLFGFFHDARQLGLARDEVEAPCEALEEARVLSEVVRAQDYVALAAVDRVVEALGEIAGVTRHADETNLSLLPRLRGEFVPLRILEPCRIVDRMIEVH